MTYSWTCNSYILLLLPLRGYSILGTELDQAIANANHYLKALNESNCNWVIFAHLNIQFINSSFPEFEAMSNQKQFDILALSKILLKDNDSLLQYVRIPGCAVNTNMDGVYWEKSLFGNHISQSWKIVVYTRSPLNQPENNHKLLQCHHQRCTANWWSDHSAPYVITQMRKRRYERRYKFIYEMWKKLRSSILTLRNYFWILCMKYMTLKKSEYLQQAALSSSRRTSHLKTHQNKPSTSSVT